MNTDIAYIVSHGFAARMVMQTNLLGLLVKEGKKVALIAPDKEDDNLKKYCQENGVVLYEFSPQSSFWTAQYHDARKYFLEDIRANPALWEKHIYATRYNKARNPWKHIRPRLLYLIHQLRKWYPGLKNWYKKREEQQLESELANKLITEIQPELIVSTYPVNFSEAMLLKAAKKQQTKTIIHLLSWDNISCKGHFPQLADEYIAWGPIMKSELQEYYNIAEDKIHVCGVPHFDIHIESKQNPKPQRHLEKLGLNPAKPYLFFGMSSPRFAPKEIDIVEWLAIEIEKNTFGKEMQLVVRPHPQNVQGGMSDQSWLPRLKAIHNNRTAVDFPNLVKSKMPWSMQEDDMKRLSHLLAGCSVSLNSGSTLSIDALMCGVPVILTSFDGGEKRNYWKSARRLIDYTHLRKLVKLGGVSMCNNYKGMEALINNYLNDSRYIITDRNQTVDQQIGRKEHSSTNAVVRDLLMLLENSNTVIELH